MTLIAQLSVNGAPILIGDVLLSSEARRGLKVNLPLVGDINRILADNDLLFEEPRPLCCVPVAEVAIPRNLFADILRLIAELRPPPVTSTA
jgi:hypothetical protein